MNNIPNLFSSRVESIEAEVKQLFGMLLFFGKPGGMIYDKRNDECSRYLRFKKNILDIPKNFPLHSLFFMKPQYTLFYQRVTKTVFFRP